MKRARSTPLRAVVVGAGAIGRGFLGQLSADAGGTTTFLDVDEALVAALNRRGGYPLDLVSDDTVRALWVPRVAAAMPDTPAAQVAIARADWMATCVGARHLTSLAPALARGLQRRFETRPEPDLNVIVAENLPDAAAVLRSATLKALPAIVRRWARQRVGFVDASIGRMVPHGETATEVGDDDALRVRAESYAILPLDADAWRGPRLAVPGFDYRSPFAAVVETKRFLHNLGHAVTAYHGALRGAGTLADCMAMPEVARETIAAMNEAVLALSRKWSLDRDDLEAHAADLRHRFANRALGDPVARVAADPLRKLARDERLVGAVRLALEQGVEPVAMARAVAAALRYDAPDDPSARELASGRVSLPEGEWLTRVTGLAPDAPAYRWIQTAWQERERPGPG